MLTEGGCHLLTFEFPKYSFIIPCFWTLSLFILEKTVFVPLYHIYVTICYDTTRAFDWPKAKVERSHYFYNVSLVCQSPIH